MKEKINFFEKKPQKFHRRFAKKKYLKKNKKSKKKFFEKQPQTFNRCSTKKKINK